MSERKYRAICFDLDGTLLPQELEDFLGRYFKALAVSMVKQGAPLDEFKASLNAGTKAMIGHDGGATNCQVYWQTFMSTMESLTGQTLKPQDEWVELFTHFYENEFGLVGADVVPDESMVGAVQSLAEKGYPLMLTTMPLFPPQAVEWRLKWAGLDAGQFERLTTYENSTSSKPKLTYYAENLAAMGLCGQDVLMVGNNTVEDLAFMKLGADAYVVTDHLLDPVGFDLSQVKHGSAADFLEWVNQLPMCENPVSGVQTGVVDAAAAAAALEANLSVSAEELARMEAEERRARSAADDIGDAISGAGSSSAEKPQAGGEYVHVGMDQLDGFTQEGER